MNPLRTPVVLGVGPRTGAGTVAAALHAHNGSVRDVAADVVVCSGAEESLRRAEMLAVGGTRPLLVVVLLTAGPAPTQLRLRLAGQRYAGVTVLPHVEAWSGPGRPADVAGLLGRRPDQLPPAHRAYAAALRAVAAALLGTGLLERPQPPVIAFPQPGPARPGPAPVPVPLARATAPVPAARAAAPVPVSVPAARVAAPAPASVPAARVAAPVPVSVPVPVARAAAPVPVPVARAAAPVSVPVPAARAAGSPVRRPPVRIVVPPTADLTGTGHTPLARAARPLGPPPEPPLANRARPGACRGFDHDHLSGRAVPATPVPAGPALDDDLDDEAVEHAVALLGMR